MISAAEEFHISLLAVLLVGTLGLRLTGCKTEPRSSPPAVSHSPLLIKHGQDAPYPFQVSKNANLIDSRPFNGITVALEDEFLTSTAKSYSTFESDLLPMPHLGKVTKNFIIARMLDNSGYDFYSDAIWSIIAANAANLSKAARDNGNFIGLAIDDEYYGSGTNPWNFGSSTPPAWTYSATEGATPGHTAEDARAKVQARGTQVMDAIKVNWPTAVVTWLQGPYVSESMTAKAWNPPKWNDLAWANELSGAFFVGMIKSAVGTNVQLTDGGEVYTARTSSDYAKVHAWQKTGLADSGTPNIPPSLVATFKRTVHAALGVYDYDVTASLPWPLVSTSLWQSSITNALNNTDQFVWLYTEAYDWMGVGGKPPVPQSWLGATAAGTSAEKA